MKRSAWGHTKMQRLARRLDIDLCYAAGVLEAIWHLCERETPQGNIGKLSNEDITIALGSRRDPDELIQHLVDTGWIDEHPEHRLIVHDWPDHCEDMVHNKLARETKYFADGRRPKLTRLSDKERDRIEVEYAKLDQQPELQALKSAAERSEAPQSAVERLKAHSQAVAMPSPAMPEPRPEPLPSTPVQPSPPLAMMPPLTATPFDADFEMSRDGFAAHVHRSFPGPKSTSLAVRRLLRECIRSPEALAKADANYAAWLLTDRFQRGSPPPLVSFIQDGCFAEPPTPEDLGGGTARASPGNAASRKTAQEEESLLRIAARFGVAPEQLAEGANP